MNGNQVLVKTRSEKWEKRIPGVMLVFTVVMVLIGARIDNASSFMQHLYIFIFGIGIILLVLILMILHIFERKKAKTIIHDIFQK